jgi:hypothetical protein
MRVGRRNGRLSTASHIRCGADVTEVAVAAFDVVEVVDVVGLAAASSKVVVQRRMLSNLIQNGPDNDLLQSRRWKQIDF